MLIDAHFSADFSKIRNISLRTDVMNTDTIELSPSSDSVGHSKKKLIVATTLGNALEFFDFTVYGFLAIVLGKVFFPEASGYGQALLSVATFGIGFVARPLGGIVIGAYADRSGRRAAMLLTILLMALGCAIIGFTPGYATIGITAPILLVIARLIQGFSAGGEVGTSTTVLLESAPAGQRAYYSSWQFASQGIGVTLGAAMVGCLAALLSPAALEQWGWRVPFLAGLVIAPIGLYIRSHLIEVKAAPSTIVRSPLRIVVQMHAKALLFGTLLTCGNTVYAYVVAFYMPSYAVRQLGLPISVGLWAATLSGSLTFVSAPLVGIAADRFGRKNLIILGRIGLATAVYPLFLWLTHEPNVAKLLWCVSILSVLLTIQAAPSFTILPEMFPRSVRATGMSVIYSIGVAVFGGFAQLIATWLVHVTGTNLAVAWYLIAAVVVSSIALPWISDRTGEELD